MCQVFCCCFFSDKTKRKEEQRSSRYKRDHWPWLIAIVIIDAFTWTWVCFDQVLEFSGSHVWICASKHRIWISKALISVSMNMILQLFRENWRKTWDCGMRAPNPGYWQRLSTCATTASGRWHKQNKHLNSLVNKEPILVFLHCRGLLAFKSAKPHDKPQRFSHNSKLLQSAVIRYQDVGNYRIWKTRFFLCAC